jgi:hypothetical protein
VSHGHKEDRLGTADLDVDTATTPVDTPVTIEVLGNDTDPDGDTLTVTGVTQGAHDTVTLARTAVT